MNILFYLTPKCECAFLEVTDTLRQALEKMEYHRYSAIPLLGDDGSYRGTVTEGDMLWNIKNRYGLDMRQAESISITDLERRKDYAPISIRSNMEDLMKLALDQNFVPVVDDNSHFIGIIKRKEILQYCNEKLEQLSVYDHSDEQEYK